jgi:transposase
LVYGTFSSFAEGQNVGLQTSLFFIPAHFLWDGSDFKHSKISEEKFRVILRLYPKRLGGLHKSTFYLHLKECEWWFNHHHCNTYQILLKLFRNNPLMLS